MEPVQIKACFITIQHTGTRSIQHALCSGADYVVHPDDELIEGSVIYVDHIYGTSGKRLGNVSESRMLAQKAPLIYTMRDPLASIISNLIQFDETADEHLSDWLALRDLILEFGGHPVRIDGPDTAAQLQAAFTQCGLYDMPLEIRPWGSSEPSALKTAYRAGDVTYLDKSIPSAMNAIREAEVALRPWLETHGYLNLLWWS